MAVISSLETDKPGVAILVAAHNAAFANTPSGDVAAYLRAFRRIYESMIDLAGMEDDEDDDEDED